MTTLYKLTDSTGQTRGGTQWGEGVTHRAGRGKAKLCSPTVIHAYTDPILAVMMAPSHIDYDIGQMWEARGRVAVSGPTKTGCKSLTTLRQIPIPEVTLTQRVAFGILASLEVCADPVYVAWARGWLDGSDRSAGAAAEAAAAGAAAAWAAAEAAAWAGAAAAGAAAAAAGAAAAEAADINLVQIAHKAMEVEP